MSQWWTSSITHACIIGPQWVKPRLLHSPSLVAIGLSVGYETRPPIGLQHPFVIGWSKDWDCPVPQCIMGSRDQWEFQLFSWWRHQMETLSALLAICAGNSPVTGEFAAQRPVTRSFDVFFDLRLNKRLSKQSWGWWFETPSCSLWRHRNVSEPSDSPFVATLTAGNCLSLGLCKGTAKESKSNQPWPKSLLVMHLYCSIRK